MSHAPAAVHLTDKPTACPVHIVDGKTSWGWVPANPEDLKIWLRFVVSVATT